MSANWAPWSAGNALEFYDFLIFSFFAIQIGRSLLSRAGSPTGSLLLTLAPSGSGFLTRPLGGLVIGPLGDRIGPQARHAVLLRPDGLSHRRAGADAVLSPASAWRRRCWWCCSGCCRVLRWAARWDPPPPSCWRRRRRHGAAFMSRLQHATQYFAILASGLVGFALASVLTPAALAHWGWRVAMLLGAAWCRSRCDHAAAPARDACKRQAG